MKKTITHLLCLILLTSAAAYDDENESENVPYSQPAGMQGYESVTAQEITPNAGPRVADGVDLFFTGAFIWWRARQDGVAYAQSGYQNLNGEIPVRGKFYQPRFHFDPGLKAGLGFNLGHDGFDLFLEYTWLNADNSRISTSAPNVASSTLRETWQLVNLDGSILSPGDPLLSASGRWRLHLNVLDLEMGRNFFISQFLSLRPYFGLKATWQSQHYRVDYTTDLDITNQFETFRMRMKESFWGIGTRAGIDTSWHLGCGLSIYGNAALTAILLDFSINRRDFVRDLDTDENFFPTLKTRSSTHSLKGVLETELGMRYDVWWKKDSYHFSIAAGWEEQIWWSLNQYIRMNEECAHGDLTLQGLTLKLRFDF